MRAQRWASQAGEHTAAFEAVGSWGRWAELTPQEDVLSCPFPLSPVPGQQTSWTLD